MINRALVNIANISLGGALLLIAAVVVLTVVTQAFSFEAISMDRELDEHCCRSVHGSPAEGRVGTWVRWVAGSDRQN